MNENGHFDKWIKLESIYVLSDLEFKIGPTSDMRIFDEWYEQILKDLSRPTWRQDRKPCLATVGKKRYMFFPLKMKNVGLVTEEENLKWVQGFYQDPQLARVPPYLVFHSMETLKSSIDGLNKTVTGRLVVKLWIRSESRGRFLI